MVTRRLGHMRQTAHEQRVQALLTIDHYPLCELTVIQEALCDFVIQASRE